jgi:hypothetical protein
VIEVRNAGRSAIPAASFDAGRALEFDLGGQAVALLDATVSPGGAAAEYVSVGGRMLRITPNLIRAGQMISATLLFEGEVGDLTCDDSHNPLVDIDVMDGRKAAARRYRIRRMVSWPMIVCGYGGSSLVTGLTAGFRSYFPRGPFTALWVLFIVIGVAGGVILAMASTD